MELIQQGVNPTRLAEALKLGRQTLHNDHENYQEFDVHGLLHGYSPRRSKDEERQRHLHVHKRRPGSEARELEALRRARREQTPSGEQAPLDWEGEPANASRKPTESSTTASCTASTRPATQKPTRAGAGRMKGAQGKRGWVVTSAAVTVGAAAAEDTFSSPVFSAAGLPGAAADVAGWLAAGAFLVAGTLVVVALLSFPIGRTTDAALRCRSCLPGHRRESCSSDRHLAPAPGSPEPD